MFIYQSSFFLSIILLLSLESTESTECDWEYVHVVRDLFRNKESVCRSDRATSEYAERKADEFCCVFDAETCERTRRLFKLYLIKVNQGSSSYSLCPYSYFILLFLLCECQNKTDTSLPVTPPEAHPDIVSSEFPTAFIAGGTEAKRCEFPWTAHFQIGNTVCGGVLISRTQVLTAAHCTLKSGGIVSLDLIDSDRVPNYESGIKSIIVHPQFSFDPINGYANDIAILTLSKRVRFSRCLQPILLPDEVRNIKNKRGCFIAGWGSKNKNAFAERFLRKVRVPIMRTRVCNRYVKGFNPSLLCAGYLRGGRDACSGDSGGPLMCPQNGQWVLAGIVSMGIGCARRYHPGIYTNVKYYIDWIRKYVPF